LGNLFGLVAVGVPRSILAFGLATPTLKYAKAATNVYSDVEFSASPLDLAFYKPA
jgi:hypothetical protein